MVETGGHIGIAPLARRNLGLEYLRFGLAMAVLLYHYVYYGPHVGAIPRALAGSDTFNLGRFGVAAFFVISGFVIAQSAEGKPWQAFLSSRIGRLWPAMALCATITLVTALALHPLRVIDLWRYASAVLLLPLGGSPGPYLEPAYWSIAIELRFYALVLFLLLLSRVELLASALTMLGLAGFALHVAGAGEAPLRLFLFPYIGFFGLGVVFHRFLATGDRLAGAFHGTLHMVFAVWGTQVWIAREHMPQEAVPTLPQCALIALGSAGVVAAAYVIGRNLSIAPFAVLAGGVSYPLYLLHQRFGYDLIRLFDGAMPAETARILTVAVVIALAAAIHLWIERPAGRPLKLVIARALNGRAAA